MAADLSYWVNIAITAVLLFLLITSVVGTVFVCVAPDFKEWWESPRMRLFRLGGVTTLRQRLNYPCTLCQDSMEAGDKVRTLSCDHVFHCGGGVKCENDIDRWLHTGEAMSWNPCPICRQVPRPVLPWKRPPPSSPAPSPSASALALPQLPRSSSTQDLEQPLLPPAHDETPSEASSSASAPPLQQLAQPSAPDLEEASLLPAHWFDEALPEASSSQ